MSVEQYGARLLREVQEESLDELLKDSRTTINQTPKDVLGFSQLDKLLELFRYHQRHSPPRRPGWTSTSYGGHSISDDEIEDYEGHDTTFEGRQASQAKHRPPIIEISSTKSAAGKTTILYHLAALALLPHDYGGKQSAVLWLDTDNNFSATRFAQVASHIITRSTSKPRLDNDHIISSALQHLYILKPASSASLLDALTALPSHLLTPVYRSSPNRPLALMILDSATAFTHQDRFDAEIARLEAGPNPSTSSNTQSRTSQIITALRHLQHDFESTILFTTTQHPQPHHKPPLNRLKRPTPSDAPTIPAQAPSQSPWTSLATLTLLITRIQVPQFTPNMTLDECLRDRDKRQEAVMKGRFSVGLDWEGSELWPGGVRDVANAMQGRGGFVVRIGEGRVDVE